MKRLVFFAGVLFAGLAAGAPAQNYPTRPVRIVVPSVPGGGQDVVTRALAQKFTEAWGQQVLAENRPGGGNNIGAEAVARAAPDGHTILLTSASLAIAPSLYRKLNYDPVNGLVPVSQIMTTYLVLVTHPSLPGTLKELTAHIKANPGKLNYYHIGLGSGLHMTGEMWRAAAGLDYTNVIYKGDGEAVPALLRNEVQMSFLNPTAVVQHVKAGKLRALAVSGTSRGGAFPDIPTMAELGYPEVNYVGWLGFFVPAGTPRDIIGRIAGETIRVVRLPDIASRMPVWGGDGAGTTPEVFAAKYREDIARYAKIIKMAKVPLVD
ncbi:MAG: tripartite tricarboxylate transporter substrate binding protein [Burkholderiales bacterium]|nr:tripartite tricarboxylate transporter substrate binding protein [Burkholderiales bacterium]